MLSDPSSRSAHMITVSNHERSLDARGALVDRGANGGVAGAECFSLSSKISNVELSMFPTGEDNHLRSNKRSTINCKILLMGRKVLSMVHST